MNKYVLALVLCSTFGVASVQAQTNKTYRDVEWTYEATDGSCRIYTQAPRPGSVTAYLEAQRQPASPPFIDIIAQDETYKVTVNIPASDEFQFRLWSSGGYNSTVEIDDVSYILTPALSFVGSPTLAAYARDSTSIWLDEFEFNPETMMMTVSTDFEKRAAFRFLVERAEAGQIYVFIPSELSNELSFEVRATNSFRNALADFISCQETVPS